MGYEIVWIPNTERFRSLREAAHRECYASAAPGNQGSDRFEVAIPGSQSEHVRGSFLAEWRIVRIARDQRLV
jgi:hypothetical protein